LPHYNSWCIRGGDIGEEGGLRRVKKKRFGVISVWWQRVPQKTQHRPRVKAGETWGGMQGQILRRSGGGERPCLCLHNLGWERLVGGGKGSFANRGGKGAFIQRKRKTTSVNIRSWRGEMSGRKRGNGTSQTKRGQQRQRFQEGDLPSLIPRGGGGLKWKEPGKKTAKHDPQKL